MYDPWQRLIGDLKKIEMGKEHEIMASNINRNVGNDSLGIKGNSSEVSYGGSTSIWTQTVLCMLCLIYSIFAHQLYKKLIFNDRLMLGSLNYSGIDNTLNLEF